MIPKTIHFGYFWEALPVWAEVNIAEFKAANPEWEVKVWRSVPRGFPFMAALEGVPTYRFRSDLVRYWLIYEYGGVWVDIDCRPLGPFDDELRKLGAFVCSYADGAPADNWFIGGTAGHPAWARVIARCMERDDWAFPDKWFGTWNVMMDTAHRVNVPGLEQVSAEKAWQVSCPSEWQELVSRVALREVGYVKHYRVHGHKELPVVKGWPTCPEDLVKFSREYAVEVAEYAQRPEILAAYDELRRARM